LRAAVLEEQAKARPPFFEAEPDSAPVEDKRDNFPLSQAELHFRKNAPVEEVREPFPVLRAVLRALS
jgi:hypothetical protein